MRYYITLLCLIFVLNIGAQIPEGYYSSAQGKTGYELKTALYDIIKDHTSQGYGALWGFISSNDLDFYYENDGTILDIYSENPVGADPYNFTKIVYQCGTYSSEGDCYNREHSFPKSWFGGTVEPMYSDVQQIHPTDGKVNAVRGNYPYGIVASATTTSDNGSKLGASDPETGYSGTVFEPINEFKGDLARGYFYMATRYENIIDGWENNNSGSNAVLNGTNNQVFEDWALQLLLEWHRNDPVSQKEIDRNNAAYDYQGNRNPFVDHPEYAFCVWGDNCTDTVPPADTTLPGDTILPPETCRDVFFPTSSDKPMWSEQLAYFSQATNDTSYYNNIYSLIGDTNINAKSYSKVYKLESNLISLNGAEYIGAIRASECGYVYFLTSENDESLIYDFSKEVGDTIRLGIAEYNKLLIESLSQVSLLNDQENNMFSFPESSNMGDWIDGIGNVDGLLAHYWGYPATGVYSTKLLCYFQKGELLYEDCDGSCFPEYDNSTGVLKNKIIKAVIYPQPAQDYVILSLSRELAGELKIFNTTGNQMLFQIIESKQTRICLEAFDRGIYFLTVIGKSGELMASEKIIVF